MKKKIMMITKKWIISTIKTKQIVKKTNFIAFVLRYVS